LGFITYQNKLYIKKDEDGMLRLDGLDLIKIKGLKPILIEKTSKSVDADGKPKTTLKPALGQTVSINIEWNLTYSDNRGFYLYKIIDDRFIFEDYPQLDASESLDISDMVMVGKNVLAIGTANQGIYLVNLDGTVLQHIDSKTKLANNKVNSLFYDSQHHLWAALGQGISRIKLDDQWQKFVPETHKYSGSIESVLRYNESFFIASNEGLFSVLPSDKAGESARFTKILDPLANMGCYWLGSFDKGGEEILLIVTDLGLASLNKAGKYEQIVEGFIWTVLIDKFDPNRIWLGLDDGLGSIYFKDDKFIVEGRVAGIKARCQFLEQDEKGDIWTSNIFSVVYHLEKPEFKDNKIHNYEIKGYSDKDGLPADNPIYLKLVDGQMIFATGEGIYVLDPKTNKFEPSSIFGPLFYNGEGNKAHTCHRIFQDKKQRVWLISKSLDESRLQIYRLSRNPNDKGTYFTQKAFEAKGTGDIFNAIYEEKNGVMWFGGVSSLYRFEPKENTDSIIEFFTFIHQVTAGEDTISNGYIFENNHLYIKQLADANEIIPYRNNMLTFHYSSLMRNNEEAILFSYKLDGFDDKWSKWDTRNEERFTNLSEGDYTFRVRSMDRLGNISPEAVFRFTVKPPWYRTIWAYIGYVLFFIAFVWGAITVSTRSLKKIIREATAEIQAQKDELEEKNQNILDSIRYAKRIQEAVTPTDNQMRKYFPDHFVLWRPRDIVSGDFYWMMHKKNRTVLAAADCTGHGVPGAFMSIMGISFLNQIANLPEVQTAADALNHLRHNVITSLNKEGSETDTKDGMDISLCVYDFENMIMDFSGAYNPLYIVRDGAIDVVKADRMPVGVHDRMDKSFTTNKFTMMKGDVYYILSDGYIDQFGGEKGKKFMTKRFKELILDIYQLPMEEQSKILEERLLEWRGEIEQVDDIIIIGVRVV
jgi:serine phosphatase RsbU (regulator of sigma subunit)/ligand-binding sensor domain-containing protein